MVSVKDIRQAHSRIMKHIVTTPLIHSTTLSEMTGGDVFLKLESKQVTGSFKARGALNRLMTLSKDDIKRGVITASTGNHGLGVAYAAKLLGVKAKVVFPRNASDVKKDRLLQAGVDVIQDADYDEIESYARSLAEQKGMTYVSPYNDPEIVAGAGTTGLEILDQLDNIDTVIVPIGGGGLISGIATIIKSESPKTEVVGVQSEVSPEVYESWLAGHWVDVEESDSLAQGLMGGVEADSITLDIIQEYVDRVVLVKETSILHAIQTLYERERLLIEGAGAASTAVILENAQEFSEKRVVLVLSGGNISKEEVQFLIKNQ
ncbi:MAG: threonine/serine dehydratase [Promethearchaeota archaeon]